jgi:hypothetical protein
MHEHRPVAFFIGHRSQHAIDMFRHAGAALHREPIWLVQNHQIAILEQDHLAQRPQVLCRRRMDSGARHGGRIEPQRRHAHTLPGFEMRRGFDARAVDADLPRPHDFVQMRQRQFRQPPLEPAVEPHPRFVFGDGQSRDTHVSARTIVRPATSPAMAKPTDPKT